jgi:uncharacterized protein DUF4159
MPRSATPRRRRIGPRAEQYLSQILQEMTALDVHTDANRIPTPDDPELFKYPTAFIWQPGFWNLTDREGEAFRGYLSKGGFAVFEDFDGREWSGQGLFPFDASNEAYKRGVNDVVYGLTH